jgi:hypothetical protein
VVNVIIASLFQNLRAQTPISAGRKWKEIWPTFFAEPSLILRFFISISRYANASHYYIVNIVFIMFMLQPKVTIDVAPCFVLRANRSLLAILHNNGLRHSARSFI